MIVLIATASIYLTALQASISAPTEAFRGCLRSANETATKEKVNPDGIEDYYKTTCSVQMNSLRSAVIAFRLKNGMAKKAAASDADMTVEDYMSGPADKYRFAAETNKSQAPAEAAAPATKPQ
jgi:hypothetical protein